MFITQILKAFSTKHVVSQYDLAMISAALISLLINAISPKYHSLLSTVFTVDKNYSPSSKITLRLSLLVYYCFVNVVEPLFYRFFDNPLSMIQKFYFLIKFSFYMF